MRQSPTWVTVTFKPIIDGETRAAHITRFVARIQAFLSKGKEVYAVGFPMSMLTAIKNELPDANMTKTQMPMTKTMRSEVLYTALFTKKIRSLASNPSFETWAHGGKAAVRKPAARKPKA